jgi:hypothetical protein
MRQLKRVKFSWKRNAAPEEFRTQRSGGGIVCLLTASFRQGEVTESWACRSERNWPDLPWVMAPHWASKTTDSWMAFADVWRRYCPECWDVWDRFSKMNSYPYRNSKYASANSATTSRQSAGYCFADAPFTWQTTCLRTCPPHGSLFRDENGYRFANCAICSRLPDCRM